MGLLISMKYRFCKTCGLSTYKPKQRIYTKYCDLECRDSDPEYWNSISLTKSKQVITDEHKKKISSALKKYYTNNPRNKKTDNNFQYYRQRSSFKFNIYDYKLRFDFSLIKKYGWYSPKNKGNNLKGVSKDHMLSVKEGFMEGILPEYLSHPANCELMIHKDNIKKKDKSSISKQELFNRVSKWGCSSEAEQGVCNAQVGISKFPFSTFLN